MTDSTFIEKLRYFFRRERVNSLMVRRVKEERDWGVKLILPLQYKDPASLKVFLHFVVRIVSLSMLELFYRFKTLTKDLYNSKLEIRNAATL